MNIIQNILIHIYTIKVLVNSKNIYNLFFDLLNKFLKKNNFVPQRILVLRDVNNNQKQKNEEIFSSKEQLIHVL